MSRGFRATSLSTNDFSTLYTTLPHNDKNEGTLHLARNARKAFFTSTDHIGYTLCSCQNVCDALSYLLGNIYIRFGNKLYRQIVGIPMGTNCAPLVHVADFFLIFFCYERDFMSSLSNDKQSDIIEAFNSARRYLELTIHILKEWSTKFIHLS